MTNNGEISIAASIANTFAIQGNVTNTATGVITGNSGGTFLLFNAALDAPGMTLGGTLSPGMSIGKLILRGTFAPAATVAYTVEVNRTGMASDKLLFAAGSVDIQNLEVSVTNIGAALVAGDKFEILDTQFGYANTFSSITLPAGYTWATNYTGNLVELEVLTVLPVNLTNFNAQQKEEEEEEEEEVSLSWQTATEIENAGFEIQKSADGENWEKLSFVEGMGTSYESTNYTFMDNAPTTGANYYRLKQIDYDGGNEFSNIEMVDLGRDTEINIFPNPSNGVFFIDNATIGKETTATIFSTDGKEVMQVELEGNRIDLSTLTSGTYYIEIGAVSKQVVIK